MKNKHFSLYALSVLLLTILTIPNAEALTNIPNGATVTAPPQADDAINFQAPAPGGTFVILSPTTFTGAITTTNPGIPTGTLVMNSGTTLNGAVTDTTNPLLNFNLSGNATVNGAITAQNFNLGENTLTAVGALNLPSGVVINTRVVSNALFGHIADTGANSIAGASVTVNVDASGVTVLTPGAPLFIVSAQGTTSGLPVNVTSNNVLYSFIGNNLNGNITITPILNPAVVPPGGVGSVFSELVTLAANNPGSDIATVVAALSALTSAEAIADAISQFNPNVEGALPRVSFAAAQQFQNLWSKHMGYGRCIYAMECCDDPCAPEYEMDCCFTESNCANVCNSWEVWADGFGYFGHQNARHGFSAYKANIYGGMLGFQAPVSQMFSVGLGGGYAHTDVDRKVRNNKTTI